MTEQDQEAQFVSVVSDAIRNGTIDNKGGNAFAFESNGCKIEVAMETNVPKVALRYLHVDGEAAPPLSDAGAEAISAAVDAAISKNRLSAQYAKNLETFSKFADKINQAKEGSK